VRLHANRPWAAQRIYAAHVFQLPLGICIATFRRQPRLRDPQRRLIYDRSQCSVDTAQTCVVYVHLRRAVRVQIRTPQGTTCCYRLWLLSALRTQDNIEQGEAMLAALHRQANC